MEETPGQNLSLVYELHCKSKKVLLAKAKNQHSIALYSAACGYSSAPALLVEILFFTHHVILAFGRDQVSLDIWVYMCGLPIPFHWLIVLSLCQYHKYWLFVIISTFLVRIENKVRVLQTLFLQGCLTIMVLFNFYKNFRTSLSNSAGKATEISVGIVLDLYIHLGSIAILTRLPSNLWMPFHLFRSFFFF